MLFANLGDVDLVVGKHNSSSFDKAVSITLNILNSVFFELIIQHEWHETIDFI